jgi:uncharacterized protein YjbI with pentapeptide repeats
VLLAAAVVATGLASSAVANATPSSGAGATNAQVTLAPSSPYYVAAAALAHPQVQAGTIVGGCTMNAFSKCRGANLHGQYLQGAFLAYSDLRGSDLSSVNLLQSDVSFAHLDGANLSDAQLNATSTTKASFRTRTSRAASGCSSPVPTPTSPTPICLGSTSRTRD